LLEASMPNAAKLQGDMPRYTDIAPVIQVRVGHMKKLPKPR
jgi:hypothetical protein